MNRWEIAFDVLGTMFSCAFFLAPIPTIWRIYKRKTTDDFSALPYVSTLFTAIFWIWYSLPFISSDNLQLIIPNGAGALLELIYVFIYLVNAPRTAQVNLIRLLCGCLTFFVTTCIITLTAPMHPMSSKTLLVGTICSACTVILNISPLSVMGLVIRTKSVEFMPFLISLFIFLGGTSWTIYGILSRDWFIVVPQALGCLVGAGQIVIYFMYCGNTESSSTLDDIVILQVESMANDRKENMNQVEKEMSEKKFNISQQ